MVSTDYEWLHGARGGRSFDLRAAMQSVYGRQQHASYHVCLSRA
jgi:hypothetical protein